MRVRARGLVNLVDGIEHSRESPDHLIIVDPSLKDHIGHHAEYDRAVAQAARTGGIAVTVLAHRRVVRDVAARIPVMPVFSNDMWGNAPVRSGWKSSVAVGLFRCVQLCAILPVALFNECVRIRNWLNRRARPAVRRRPEAGAAGVPNEPGVVDADRRGPFLPGPALETLSLRTRIIRSWHKHGTLHVIRTALAVLSRSIRFALTRSKIPGGTLLIRILSAVRFAASVAWNCAALCFERIRIPSIFAVLFIWKPCFWQRNAVANGKRRRSSCFDTRPRCAARIVSRRGWRFTFSSGWFRKDLYASPPTVIASRSTTPITRGSRWR